MTKNFLHILTFFAFLIQSMIPVGFMVSARADAGSSTMVICAGDGEKTVSVPGTPQKSATHVSVCPYAHASFGGDVPPAPMPDTVVVRLITNESPLDRDIVRAAVLTRPPPIGPPAPSFV